MEEEEEGALEEENRENRGAGQRRTNRRHL